MQELLQLLCVALAVAQPSMHALYVDCIPWHIPAPLHRSCSLRDTQPLYDGHDFNHRTISPSLRWHTAYPLRAVLRDSLCPALLPGVVTESEFAVRSTKPSELFYNMPCAQPLTC